MTFWGVFHLRHCTQVCSDQFLLFFTGEYLSEDVWCGLSSIKKETGYDKSGAVQFILYARLN